jgi:hypothetical protein
MGETTMMQLWEWLAKLTKGRARKIPVLIYLNPDEIVVIDEAKDRGLVESRGHYVRKAISHYKDILNALYGEERKERRKVLKEMKSR